MNDQQSNRPDNQSGQGYRIVPAATGKLWLEEAWHFFRGQTRAILFAVLLLVLIGLLSSVSVLGMVISILSPVLYAGLLLGIRAGFHKPPARINLLAAWQLTDVRKELVILGLILTLVGLVFSYLAGPIVTELQTALANGEIPLEVMWQVVLYSLVSITIIGFCTWLALPEIAFRGRPILSAVILSVQATLANWRAFSILGLWLMLVWVAIVIAVSIFSILLVTVTGSSIIGTFIISLPVLALWLGFMGLMYVLQYICWRDIIADPAEENPSTEHDSEIVDHKDEENTRVII